MKRPYILCLTAIFSLGIAAMAADSADASNAPKRFPNPGTHTPIPNQNPRDYTPIDLIPTGEDCHFICNRQRILDPSQCQGEVTTLCYAPHPTYPY